MSIEEIKHSVNLLKSEQPSIKYRERLISELLEEFPFWIQSVKHKIEGGQETRKFFRCRNDFFDDLKYMCEPPKEVVRSSGRANYIGESVLYCTDTDFYSCILELVDRNNLKPQQMTVIEFESVKDFYVVPVGIVDRETYTKLLEVDFNESEFEKYTIISKFMDEEFRMHTEADDRNYQNSSVIAKLVMDWFPQTVGIRYKTVQNFNFFHRGLNYAFMPERVEGLFKFNKAIQYEYHWKEDKMYQFQPSLLRTGTIHNNGMIEYVDETRIDHEDYYDIDQPNLEKT